MKNRIVVASILMLCSSLSYGWVIPENPDRTPSLGVNVLRHDESGGRTEVERTNNPVLNTPARNDMDRNYSELGADIRIPILSNLTINGYYATTESNEHSFYNGSAIGVSEELKGKKYGAGIRLYMNR